MNSKNEKKISVDRERPFSPHHIFLNTAREALSIAENDPSKSSFSAVTVITMSALAIESLCNAIGERVVEGWSDFESSSPKAKLRIICDELNITYDVNLEPWSTAVWLSNIRNKLAHGKPQLIKKKGVKEKGVKYHIHSFSHGKKGSSIIFTLSRTGHLSGHPR